MAFSFFMKRTTPPKKEEKRHEAKKPTSRKPSFAVSPAVAKSNESGKPVYAFIDASNLFWGGRESIGFKINYSKLLRLLEARYGVTKAYYYSGIRIFNFEYSILDNKDLDLAKLGEYLAELEKNTDGVEAELVAKTISKLKFYQLLESYGYVMKIKPAKVSYDEDDENQEHPILKANCDVDMTFDMMRYLSQYSGVVAMTGDGDFASVLSYLKAQDRSLTIISRWDRTAKEIRELGGDDFVDFNRLHHQIRY